MKGFSIYEVIISLFFCSLITLNLFQALIFQKKHFTTSKLMLERKMDYMALEIMLKRSARMAGFTPCLSLEKLKKKQNISSFKLLPNGFAVNYMSELFIEPHNLTKDSFTSYKKLALHKNTLIADCFNTEVRKLTKYSKLASGYRYFFDKPLNFKYQKPSYLGALVFEKFSATSRKITYQINNHVETILVNVATFQVKHGHKLLKILIKEPLYIYMANL